jgi:hypothetical protein
MSSTGSIWEQLTKRLSEIKELPPKGESSGVGQAEELAFEDEIEQSRRKTELLGLKQDISERKAYARKTFRLICGWLIGVFLLLLLQGFLGENPSYVRLPNGYVLNIKFNLADNVLIAVVGGTTASVIGIFVYVVKYLFQKR